MASSGAALAMLAKNKGKAEEAPVEEAQAETVETTETEGTAAEGEAEEATVTVDVNKLTGPQLDELVAEHDIQTPEGWKKMKVAEKRAWLEEAFADPAEADEAAPSELPEVDANAGAETAEEATPATAEATTDAQWAEAAPEAERPEETGTAVATTAEAAPGGKKPTKSQLQKAFAAGEIVAGSDPIQDVVHLVENLKENDARKLVSQVANNSEFARFKLGGLLSVIQSKGWFAPYTSFKEYVEQEVGLEYRKATYWTRIYNDLANAGIPWETIASVPWTKLKEISSLLTTENVGHWVKVSGENSTVQLIEIVRHHKASAAGANVQIGADVKTVTTMTFKVDEDQKATLKGAIEKARVAVGTDATDTKAMELIALEYLNTAPSMEQLLKGQGLEKALELFEKAFPDVNLTVEIPEAAAA